YEAYADPLLGIVRVNQFFLRAVQVTGDGLGEIFRITIGNHTKPGFLPAPVIFIEHGKVCIVVAIGHAETGILMVVAGCAIPGIPVNAFCKLRPEAIRTGRLHLFGNIILGSKTILWNGPMGVFEMEKFHYGTLEVANLVASVVDDAQYPLRCRVRDFEPVACWHYRSDGSFDREEKRCLLTVQCDMRFASVMLLRRIIVFIPGHFDGIGRSEQGFEILPCSVHRVGIRFGNRCQ
ncbi:MAG: phosphoglycerate kinase, partial [Cytophagaceae bacterium]